MNDELNTLINEIEESNDNDESVASGEDTKPTSGEDDLDVEAVFKSSSETPKKSASEIAEQQKEAWARNIASGKKTLEELESTPSAKWMVQDVKKRLGLAPSVDEIDERFRALDSQKQFNKDMEALKSLPIEAKRKIVEMSKEYMELGVSSDKALRKAMEKSKGIVEEMETVRKQRVEAGQLPTGKAASGQAVYSAEQVAKMSQAEYNHFRELERKGEVVMKLS